MIEKTKTELIKWNEHWRKKKRKNSLKWINSSLLYADALLLHIYIRRWDMINLGGLMTTDISGVYYNYAAYIVVPTQVDKNALWIN